MTEFIFCRERFRTAVNIMGDSYGAGIVNHLSKSELAKMPQIIPLENAVKLGGKEAEENDLQV